MIHNIVKSEEVKTIEARRIIGGNIRPVTKGNVHYIQPDHSKQVSMLVCGEWFVYLN